MQIRVYYEDTDCGNVVYYANYLRFMERSRTEFLRERGIDLSQWHKKGFTFVVFEVHGNYHASAKYNDLLEVESHVTECTAVSVVFATSVKLTNGPLLFDGTVRLACISKSNKPTRIPKEITRALSID